MEAELAIVTITRNLNFGRKKQTSRDYSVQRYCAILGCSAPLTMELPHHTVGQPMPCPPSALQPRDSLSLVIHALHNSAEEFMRMK